MVKSSAEWLKEVRPVERDVYDVYEAVERCVFLYAEISAIVTGAMRTPKGVKLPKTPAARAKKLGPLVQGLRKAAKVAGALVEPLKRDIHRASRGLVDWNFVKGSSYAEATVAAARWVTDRTWTGADLSSSDRLRDRMDIARHGAGDRELLIAQLNLEAARVVAVQERKGPDLSLMTPTQRKVYAAVLLHGPLTEKQINLLLHNHPTKGNSRKLAGLMANMGIFERTNDGYRVRKSGDIVGTSPD